MGHVGEMRETLELRLPQNGKLVFAFVFFSCCTCCCKMDLGLPGKGEVPILGRPKWGCLRPALLWALEQTISSLTSVKSHLVSFLPSFHPLGGEIQPAD